MKATTLTSGRAAALAGALAVLVAVAGCVSTMPADDGETTTAVTTIKGGIGTSGSPQAVQLTDAQKASASASEFYRVREIGKAIEQYERAMSLDPKLVEAYHGLAHIYLVETQEFDKALALYEQARTNDPKGVYSRTALAYAYSVVGRYQDSVNEYVEAARMAPDDADVFLNLGYVYEKMQMDLAALNSYRRAVELSPDDPRPAQALAQICYRAELYDQAIAGFEIVKARGSASQYVRSTLGYCYLKVGSYQKAELLFLAVLQENPQDFAARANLATVYRSMEQYGKAVEQYEALVQQSPTDATYLTALADAYNDAGQYEAAISTARRMLSLMPSSGAAYIPWAKALEKQGRNQDAIAQLEKAARDPEWKAFALKEIERQNTLIEIAEQRKLRQIWDQGD
jgi:tetratricopeptide (TPR) repeat protein